MPLVLLAATAVALSACDDREASAPKPSNPASASAQAAAASVAPSRTAIQASSQTSTHEQAPVATIIAAGDVAACDEEGDSATAALIAELDEDATIATLGDTVYPSGSDATFARCYDAVWGAWRDRTRPALGNHDVQDDGGAAYHRYFGRDGGGPGEGYYSYDIGAWHVVVLNSNCDLVPCGPNTAQHNWLLKDLAANDAACALAYWHHPRFSSGPHGDTLAVAPLWEALYSADADVVLVGHDHLYERFAPQTPAGEADPEGGMRQFTVGTGGKELYAAVRDAPNSEVIIDDSFGVLELTLREDGYDWRFLTTTGLEADTGSADCH